MRPVRAWGEATWRELDATERAGLVAILPLGAIEAHGPHLPLATDATIAEAMAREGARRLAEHGVAAIVLPTLAYAPAPYAAGFPGTLSIRPETLAALVEEIAASLAAQGVGRLALANAHFDPAQVAALRGAVARIRARGEIAIAFPDLTRRALAVRLTAEFVSGACHAGRYETSIVLAERPEAVREELRGALPANPVSLTAAIAAGFGEFRAAGGAEAYFGDPAAASADEGRATVALLGAILAESVLAVE